MKKLLIYFSILVLSSLLCQGQDTISMLNGNKILAKNIDAAKRIYYKYYNDTVGNWHVSERREVAYIHYAGGTKVTITDAFKAAIRAEKDSLKLDGRKKFAGAILINAGAGFSTIEWAAGGLNIGGGGPTFLTLSPALNTTIDYNIIFPISLGIGGAYQTMTDIPSLDDDPVSFETETITRYNLAGRLLFHFSSNHKNDFYIGTRIGESIWIDKAVSNQAGVNAWYTTLPAYSERTSFQVLFGYRGFISEQVGLHVEAGIGTPYLIEAGLCFRIKTKKAVKN